MQNGNEGAPRALRAVGILFGLGLTVPLMGLLMIPVVTVATVGRAITDAQGSLRTLRLLE
jgi:hypothetical protein